MSTLYVDPDRISSASNELRNYAAKISTCHSEIQSVICGMKESYMIRLRSKLKRNASSLCELREQLINCGCTLGDVSDLYRQLAVNVTFENCLARANGYAPATTYSTQSSYVPSGYKEDDKRPWYEIAYEGLKQWTTDAAETVCDTVKSIIDSEAFAYITTGAKLVVSVVGMYSAAALAVGIIVGTGGVAAPFVVGLGVSLIAGTAFLGNCKTFSNTVADICLISQGRYAETGDDHVENAVANTMGSYVEANGGDAEKAKRTTRIADDLFDTVSYLTDCKAASKFILKSIGKTVSGCSKFVGSITGGLKKVYRVYESADLITDWSNN